MRGNLKWLAVSVGLAVGGGAMAQEAAPAAAEHEPMKVPSADAVRETWNYFYKAQGQGPVLGDAKLCTDVAKDGPNKFECTSELPAEGVKANTNVLVWQIYLVPQGDTEELVIQTKLGNQVRETKDVKVKGEGWKTRTWNGVRLNKAGDWTISIIYTDKAKNEEHVLKSFNVKAL